MSVEHTLAQGKDHSQHNPFLPEKDHTMKQKPQQNRLASHRAKKGGLPLVFLFLLIAFFPQVFFLGKVAIPRMSDMHLFYYSLSAYFKNMTDLGVFPLWNPFSFCGYPYGANAQSGVNLLNGLVWLLGNMDLGWNVMILGNIFLAAFFTYRYMLRLGVPAFGGVVSGILFAFSPSSGCAVDCWGFFLPLGLWLIEGYFATRKVRYLLAAGVSFCACFLTALPQYSLYMAAFFALYVLIRFRSLLGIGVLAFAGGAASFHLFRLFESLSLSPRGNMWFGNVLLPTHLIKTLFPFIFDSPFLGENNFFFAKIFGEFSRVVFHTTAVQYLLDPPYVGILGLTFFFLAWRQKGVARIYQGAVLIIALYMMTFPLLSPLYKYIPVLAQLPRIARLTTVFTFAMAILAGMGVQRFLAGQVRLRPLVLFYGGLSVLIVGTMAMIRIVFNVKGDAIRGFLEQYVCSHIAGQGSYKASLEFYLKRVDDFFVFIRQWTDILSPAIFVPIIFMVLTLGLLMLWKKRKIGIALFSLVCVVLISTDLMLYWKFGAFYCSASSRELKPDSKTLRFLQSDPGVFRVMPVLDDIGFGGARERDILAPDSNLLYLLASVEGYDPLFPGRYAAFFHNFQTDYDNDPALILSGPEGGFDYRMADFLNVKYFFTSKRKQLEKNYPMVCTDEKNRVFLNPHCLQRAFLCFDYRVIPDGKELLEYLKSDRMAFNSMVVLEEVPELSIAAEGKPGPAKGRVLIRNYTPHRVDLGVIAPANGILVLTDNHYPGWRATVDGIPVKILRANYAFRAVEIPRGKHVVSFFYEPESLRRGLVVSFVFIVMGLMVCWRLRRSKSAAKVPA